jgi:carboxyl-terminal processing protease
MRLRPLLRSLVLAFLLATLLTPAPTPLVASAATCDTPESSPGLGVISEAADLLAAQYIDPIPVSFLLSAAAEATKTDIERQGVTGLVPDPPKSFGEGSGVTSRFAAYYCQLWDVARDGTNPDATAYAGIRAMTAAVNEAHTRFFTPEMYQAHLASLSGDERFEGIGATLRANPLSIDYVFPDTPAEGAGLLAGDQIVSIDGRPSATLSAEEAARQMRGAAGSTVTLGIRRPGTAGDQTIPIVRAVIRVPTTVSTMVEDVGHLRLRSFPGTAVQDEVASELAWFNAMGARALILDLRGNSGGRLDTGTRIANLFLPAGAPIYRSTTRQGRTTTRASAGGPQWTKPIVVLIDQGTASMGEILAAALKEQAGAPLIGSNTAGAVAGSIVIPLSDGSAIQVTTLRIDSSLGSVLNVVGLQPDVAVPPPTAATRGPGDAALNAALAYLRAPVQAGGSAWAEPMAPGGRVVAA